MLRIRMLEEPYAAAAGTTILANVAAFGALPHEIVGDYSRFVKAQEDLQSARASDAAAQSLDPFVDRAVTLPAKICESIIESHTSAPDLSETAMQRLRDARQIRSEYPDDLRELVNVAYVEEWHLVGRLLTHLATTPELQPPLERLALHSDIEVARKIHEAYGKALGITVASSADDAPTPLTQWRDALYELLIAARFLERTHPGLYALFADPYSDQLAQQQSARQNHRRRLQQQQAVAPETESPAYSANQLQ